MDNYSDNDILVINSQGDVQFNLTCCYGQSVKSTVYHRKLNGTTDNITEFIGNIENFSLGNSSLLKDQVFEIHSTIHGIRDLLSGKKAEDIKLNIEVCYSDDSVDTEFIKKQGEKVSWLPVNTK